jgi:uncharacterized protein (TIGR02217 family)
VALSDGRLACWDLEEASGDRIDHVSGLVLHEGGTPTVGVPGKVGRAARFTGTNWLSVALPGDAQLFQVPFTLAFWLWIDAYPTAESWSLVSTGHSLDSNQYYFFCIVRPDTHQIQLGLYQGFGGVVTSVAPPPLGAWTLVVAWSEAPPGGGAGPTALQLNNGPIATGGIGTTTFPFGTPLVVGAIGSGSFSARLHGSIDALMYWNRALSSQAERDLLWNGGAGSACAPAPLPTCEPLPQWIAYGATGGPEWGTALFSAPGGWEQRTQQWAQVRGRWDVSFVHVTQAQATVLVDFFRAVAHGRAEAFCFTDWRDHTFSNVIGTGDGTTTTFQLVKVYTSGTLRYARPLTRPLVSSLAVMVNGVPTTAYTVGVTGGVVQFASPPPSGAVIHAAGEFEVLVRFDTDQMQVTCVAPDVFSCAGLGLVELIGE